MGAPRKILIIGNFGAGKSSLARILSEKLQIPTQAMDTLLPPDSSPQQARSLLLKRIETLVTQSAWILEGTYGDAASIALTHADLFIWLDLPREVCLQNIRKRKPNTHALSAQEESFLEQQCLDYDRGNSFTSRTGHRALFELFTGEKVQLKGPQETTAWLETLV